MGLPPDSIPHFGKIFLEEIDGYISKRYKELTSDDIYNIYYQFFDDMKKLKGNSNGFIGLSEYLLFRSVYHLLGGSFELQEIPKSQYLYKFVSKTDNKLCISQSTPVLVEEKEKRIYPDISIWYNEKLLAVCQIKIYLTNGQKEVEAELDKLDCLRRCYSELHALLMVFMPPSAKGKITEYLNNETSRRPWFKYHFLRGEKAILVDVMKEGLGLQQLVSQSVSK